MHTEKKKAFLTLLMQNLVKKESDHERILTIENAPKMLSALKQFDAKRKNNPRE